MHTGIATITPINKMTGVGRPLVASAVITVKATIAPIITTSPCAKLINWMMP